MRRVWANAVRVLCAAICAILFFAPSSAHAQTAPPSLEIAEAPQVTASDAWNYFTDDDRDVSPACDPSPCPIDGVVQETADALGGDPLRIFTFVYNEMEIVPLFGVQKGARGCLIDKACTPFDQVMLLHELLRASGHAPEFEFGLIRLTPAELVDWYGLEGAGALDDILADSGIPFTVTGSGPSTEYTLVHLWVRVTLNATTYRLDPSFKTHTDIAGIDVDDAMGLNASTLMSSALSGSSSTSVNAPQVAAFNRGNLRDDLQEYSEDLLTEIRTAHPDADLQDIIGGREIDRFSGSSFPTPAYEVLSSPDWPIIFTNQIPYALRTQVTVNVGSSSPDVFYWRLDEFYGEELTLIPIEQFPGPGSPDPIQYRFHRNGVPITGWRIGAGAGVGFNFDHPYAADGGAYLDRNIGGGGDFHAGAIQFIVGGGHTSSDLGAYMEPRSSSIEGFVEYPPASEPGNPSRVGAQRATKRRTAATFAAQFTNALSMMDELGGSRTVVHDFVVTAQTIPVLGGTSWTPQSTIGAMTVMGAISANAHSEAANDTRATRRAAAAALGLLEGSAVAQNLDSVNMISTATRFDWFSSSSENSSTNRRFYWANSANWTYVSAQIQADGYYGEAATRTLALPYIDAGYTVILPRSSYLGPGVAEIITCNPVGGAECAFPGPERGTAIIAISPEGIAHVVTAQNVALKGGGGTDDAETNPTRIFAIPEDFLERQFTTRAEAYNVDMSTGVVTYTPPPDLVVGEGAYPYSLSFQRSYRSGIAYDRYSEEYNEIQAWEEEFGTSGWTSNFMAEARMQNEGDRAFGGQSPREATDTIVALRVLLALSGDQGTDLATLQYQLGAIHTMAWWSEQLRHNAVQIVEGASNRSFFRLADGTFQGQPGDATIVALEGAPQIVPDPDLGYYTPRRWSYNGMCVRATNTDGSISYFGAWTAPGFTVCNTSATGPAPAAGVKWMRFRQQVFREGVTVTMTENDTTRVATLSNNLGRSITLTPTNNEPLLPAYTIRDDSATSRTVSIALDLSVNGPGSMSVTGTDGNAWLYDGSSDANWRIFAPSDDENPIVTFAYVWGTCPSPPPTYPLCPADTRVRGQVDVLTDAVGNDASYFISTGRIAAMRDPEDNETRTYYDRNSQPIRVTNRLGYDTYTEYDNFRRVVAVTYPEGNREEYEYNPWHARTVTRRVAKPNGVALSTETITTYEDDAVDFFATCGMPLSQEDANGNITTYSILSGRCLISSMTQPAVDDGATGSGALVNPVTSYTWNGLGQLLTRVDPTSREVRNAYNNTTHYLQTVTVENGGSDIVTSFGRDSAGDITSVTDPRSNVHTGEYDLSRRLTRYQGPSGTNAESRWTYNSDGLVTFIRQRDGASTDPDEWSTTEYRYFRTGRPSLMVNPDGGVTQYSYDALNRPDCVAVRMNPAVYAVITDPDTWLGACSLSSEGADGPDRISRSIYDAEGQVLQELRAYASDDAIIYATRTWTPNGQLATVKDANNNLSNLEYDRFDRLARLYFPDPATINTFNPLDYEAYTYDNNDNRISLRLRSGDTDTIAYTYDALNREVFKDIPGGTGADVTSRYDLSGRRTFARFSTTLTPSDDCTADNPGVDYCYDAVGRLSDETSYGRRLQFQYDQASNRTRITHPDGLYFQYTYDALNRGDQVQLNGSSSGLSLIADYAYDPISRRTELVRGNGGETTYAYTQASRLAELDHDLASTGADANWAFAYNVAGQVNSRTLVQVYERTVETLDQEYAANGLNQYTEVGGEDFTHDDRGNLTDDGARSFTYDLENRLLTASGTVEGTLAYDPLGRLRSFTHDSETIEFLYDGDRLVGEFAENEPEDPRRRYAHGPGVDEPLIWYEGSTTSDPNWLIADRQGSIIATTDASGVATTYAYDPYGRPREWLGPRFRYTGQASLPELELYHYKARVYDPALGRFLQTDPVGYEDDLNLYQYTRNDPINAIDASGRRVIFVGGGGDAYPKGTPGRHTIVQDYSNRFRAAGDVPGGVHFFRNYEGDQIAQSIQEGAAAGEPVVVVGHSWGGTAAFEAAGASGANVDLLVTVDPVGRGATPDRPGNVQTWMNVTANPTTPGSSDNIVAGIGGKPSNLPTDQADMNLEANRNHGEFGAMLNDHSFDGLTPEELIRREANR